MWFGILTLGIIAGVMFGIYFCRLRLIARRKVKPVTLAPEATQLASLITDLRIVKTDLQGTARLLAERAAQHTDNTLVGEPEFQERNRRGSDRKR